MARALFELWPRIARAVPLAALGDFPTPVESLAPVIAELGLSGPEVYVKRDDLSSDLYGGNKVRPLELLFGWARERGRGVVYATGAYGSNHALATLLHAPRVGLRAGALLFPQPVTPSALATLEIMLSQDAELHTVSHWSALPLGMAVIRARSALAGEPALIMPPGGATPRAVLAYVSAGLELALQVERGVLPAPSRVFAAAGSNATCAGLLAGFTVAARLGLGFRSGAPRVCAVRIGPWPVTSRTRIVSLSLRTLALLARLAGEPRLLLGSSELATHLEVSGDFLGRGYGHQTDSANEACRVFAAAGLPLLDETYSGKAGAALIAELRSGARGPLLFWSTKSSRPLPEPDREARRSAPPALERWLERARASRDAR